MLSVGVAATAFAQKAHGGSGVHTISRGHGFAPSHLSVGLGIHPSYGYWGYNPWYSFRPYGYPQAQSKLALNIEEIKLDYEDRIWSVKHDKSLFGKERRQMVRSLKTKRDKDILNAKLNYYKSPSDKKEAGNSPDDPVKPRSNGAYLMP